jgi:hypothetical protein
MMQPNWLGWKWFDDSNKPVTDKIVGAIERYRQKFAQVPDVCYLNPGQMPKSELRIGPVKIEPSRLVHPNNFWLGMTAEPRKKTKC